MARKPVSVFKRPTQKKGQFRYYVKIWDETRGEYTQLSAASILKELRLDEKRFSPTSRTGALLIGQEFLKRGRNIDNRSNPLLSDFCASVWNWDTSPYIQGKIARGLRIGRQHAKTCASFIKNYIQPAFPALTLSALRPYHVETFILGLKKTSTLGNRSINAVLDALNTPLKEAARLGLIESNPAARIVKLAIQKREKGIPKEDELRAVLSLPNIDLRIQAAMELGAVCGLRLGEIQALKMEDIENDILHVRHSWSKMDGLKTTKTGKDRIVPLPEVVKRDLIALSEESPYGSQGFLMYGLLHDSPLDCRVIERGFDEALVRVSLGDSYGTAARDEKDAALASWKARNITFHSLRHFANAHLRGAVSDETLRKLTGHTTEEMTNHYDHTTEADLKALALAQESRILPFFSKNIKNSA